MKTETKKYFKIGLTLFVLYLGIYYWPNMFQALQTLAGAAAPLLVGCVVAYILNILMSYYELHLRQHLPARRRRIICLLLALLTVIAIITLIIVLIIPQLTACIKLLVAELPLALKNLSTQFEAWGIISADMIESLNTIDWSNVTNQIFHTLSSGVSNVIDLAVDVASSVAGIVVTGFLSTIFAIYLLLSKEKLQRQVKTVMAHYLPKRRYQQIMYVLEIVNDCFHRYIVGQCTEAVILGVLCFIGMSLLGLPYAAMISALIAFTALIPIAGAYIGGGIGAFMICSISPIQAVMFILFLVILQQVEGNLIYPRVVGSSLGLPGIWVLAAVTIGGGTMGIIGMLLGVPLAAALYRLLRNDVYHLSSATESS